MKYLTLLFFSVAINSIFYCQSFTDINADIIGTYFGATAHADIDGDGDQDIIISGSEGSNSSSTKLYRNNDGEFIEISSTNIPNVTLAALEFGDINNDGLPDLLIQGYIEEEEIAITKLFKNNGDFSFTEISIALPGLDQGAIDWGDMNNDGFLDFAISGFDDAGGSYITKIFVNNQNETFSELAGTSFPGTFSGKVKWADYDNDSYPDLLITGFAFSGFITEVWHNNGDESFSISGIDLQESWLGDLEWADYDNDGFVDLFLTGDNGGVKYSILYHNEGDGTFTDSGQYFPGVSHSSIEWTDIDQDGDLDVFISGTGSSMGSGSYVTMIFENDGGNFSMFVELSGTYWGDCKVFDFNGDSFPDLLLNGYDANEAPYSALLTNDLEDENTDNVVKHEMETKFGPNPTTDFLQIVNESSIIKNLIIYDLEGRIIQYKKTYSHQETINVSNLTQGIYSLQIVTEQGSQTHKFILE